MSLHSVRNASRTSFAARAKDDSVTHLLIRKLMLRSPLNTDEQAAIRSLPIESASFGPKQDLISEGSYLSKACILVDGIAGRQKLLSDGSRQIVSVYVRGDALELCAKILPVADCSVSALSRCSVAFIPHAALYEAAAAYPRIEAAFLRETLVDAAILREWLLNVGRRPTAGWRTCSAK